METTDEAAGDGRPEKLRLPRGPGGPAPKLPAAPTTPAPAAELPAAPPAPIPGPAVLVVLLVALRTSDTLGLRTGRTFSAIKPVGKAAE